MKISKLGYTLPFTSTDIHQQVKYYYGGYENNKSFHDNFISTYNSLSNNNKILVIYYLFHHMFDKKVVNFSPEDKENLDAIYMATIGKYIDDIDIAYRGLGSYLNRLIVSRILNYKRDNAKFSNEVKTDEYTERTMTDTVELDIDSLSSDEVHKNNANKYGEDLANLMDIYQNDCSDCEMIKRLNKLFGYDRKKSTELLNKLKEIIKEAI